MADAIDTAGAFVIREITGDKRTLRLVARALPYRPFTLEGEQRHDTTDYAGNPTKTLQVFGPSEKPSSINGWWKDIFIGDVTFPMATVSTPNSSSGGGQPILSARDLSDLVDDIREKGQLLEVSWLHEQRQGIIANFKKSWHTFHDLEWEITFTWIAISKNILSGAQKAISSIIRSASSLVSGFRSQVADGVQKASILEQISGAATKIADGFTRMEAATDDLTNAAQNTVQSVMGPTESALSMTGMFQGACLDAADVITAAYSRAEAAAFGLAHVQDGADPDVLAASFPDRAANASEAVPPAAVGIAVAAVQANRDVVRAARQARFRAARARSQLLKSTEPNLIAAFVAREGDDLRVVALRFYGDVNAWRGLKTFNRLTSSKLHAGDIVFVPRQSKEAA